MRKRISICMALLLSLLITVNVWADEPGYEQRPDYFTDYYMIVESPDGGIDIYSNAGTDNSKLNNGLIPNGTALHIEGEKKGDDNKEWGFTQYHGMYGYVQFDDLKPGTLSEAIESEYRLGGGEDVDYDVQVDAKSGSTALYKGPGEKYGEVSGADDIANGQKLHISQELESEDKGHWGKTEANGLEGWVSLEDTDKGKEKTQEAEETVAMVGKNDSDAKKAAAAAPQPTATPEATATPQPTATPEATATPQPTATPEPTATPQPTATPEATATPQPTATPEPTVTPASKATATPEAANTPVEEQESSSDVMKASLDNKEPELTEAPVDEAKATPTEKPEATPTKEAAPTEEPLKEATPTEEASAITPTEKPEDTEAPKEEVTPAGDKAEDASSSEVKTSSPWYKSPVVWGVAGVMLIIILILLYFLKKKK